MNTDPLPRDVELLLEAATSANRAFDASGRIKVSAAWADLSLQHRDRLFERQFQARLLERALHDTGLSTTAVAVMQRVADLPQL